MNRLMLSGLVTVLVSCSSTNIRMSLPEKVSPDVYEVLLDNEFIKMLKVSFAPGQSDNMHDHYPFTFHVFEGGKIRVTMPDGTVNETEIPTGATGYNETGVRHQVKNIGDKPIEVLLIEHKNVGSLLTLDPADDLSPEEVFPDKCDVLFENEVLKVLESTLPVGESNAMHEHGAYAVYFSSGGNIEITTPGGNTQEKAFADGAVGFSEVPVRHKAKNIGVTNIKTLIMQYK